MKKIMFNDRYGLTLAVIEGQKTVTRRILNGYPLLPNDRIESACVYTDGYVYIIANGGESYMRMKCPYQVGEVVAIAQKYRDVAQGDYPVDSRYDAFRTANWGDGKDGALKCSAGWNNKLFTRADLMPHHIRITEVKVERLQDITNEDCIKEGIRYAYAESILGMYGYIDYKGTGLWFNTPREAFASLIDKISGRGTWERNPFVWRIEFELVK